MSWIQLDKIEKHVLNVKEEKLEEYSEKIYNHFYSLRNEIDIQRETALEQIYKEEGTVSKEINCLSAELIEQIDLTEKEFRKKFMLEIGSKIDEISVDEKRKRLEKMLREASLSEKDMEKLLNESEAQMKQIQSEFAQIYYKFAARLKANEFRAFNQSDIVVTSKGNNCTWVWVPPSASAQGVIYLQNKHFYLKMLNSEG